MRFGAESILCSILAFWTKRIALPPSFPRLYLLTPFKQVMISKRNRTIAWQLLSRVRFKRLWLLSFIFLGTRLPWRELLRIALIWASVPYYLSAWIFGPSPFDDREIEFHLTFHFIPQTLSARARDLISPGLSSQGSRTEGSLAEYSHMIHILSRIKFYNLLTQLECNLN